LGYSSEASFFNWIFDLFWVMIVLGITMFSFSGFNQALVKKVL